MGEVAHSVQRWLKRAGGRGRLSAAIALLVGLVLWWEARAHFAPPSPISESRYLVARRDLGKNHALQFADLSMVGRRSLSGPLPKGAVTDQDLSLLKGALLVDAINEGTILTFGVLQLNEPSARFGSRVPKGMRAYTLHFSEVLGLQPFDFVDVILVPRQPQENPVTLVEGATVLVSEKSAEGEAVMLALDASDVGLVEKASQTGKLKLALRNPDEGKAPSHKHRGRLPKRQVAAKRVEIWSEDP